MRTLESTEGEAGSIENVHWRLINNWSAILEHKKSTHTRAQSTSTSAETQVAVLHLFCLRISTSLVVMHKLLYCSCTVAGTFILNIRWVTFLAKLHFEKESWTSRKYCIGVNLILRLRCRKREAEAGELMAKLHVVVLNEPERGVKTKGTFFLFLWCAAPSCAVRLLHPYSFSLLKEVRRWSICSLCANECAESILQKRRGKGWQELLRNYTQMCLTKPRERAAACVY